MMWVKFRNELNHECMFLVKRVEATPKNPTALYLYGEGVGGFQEAHFQSEEARAKCTEMFWRALHFGGHGKASFCTIDMTEFQ
jgi:hypothetical protein